MKSEISILSFRVPLTVPNVLSLYRLLVFPLVMLLIVLGKETFFAVMLVISLNTDVWDGWIARRFNQRTAIGARLDSMADVGVYIAALTGIIHFKINLLGPDAWLFYLFVCCYLIVTLAPLIRFGKIQSFHLYSIKLGGYLQGIFFFLLFFVGYVPPYFYLMVIVSLLAFIENLTIQLILTEMRSDVKGLYWILKARGKQDG